MSGLGDKLEGSAKEAVGKVTGDEKLEAKGKLEQITGNLKDKAEEIGDQVGKKSTMYSTRSGDKTDSGN
ncbi:CsbD family protein [Candidatus Saccharibacteria bacterium]|nr:MAG: CsbD family protein [Candidatus Saccharibacteria bacterium]